MASRSSYTGETGQSSGGWRTLGRFWLAVLGLIALGGLTLQILGPPTAPRPEQHAARREMPHPPVPVPVPSSAESAASQAPVRPGRSGTEPIAAPEAALLELAPDQPEDLVPRIGPDGRAPMAVYAAGFDNSGHLPRVGLIVAGIGMSLADSMAAIQQLPGPVTLAISPYAGPIPDILTAARQARHEFVLSLPMKPAGFPVNDPDSHHALLTSLSPAENLQRLHWVMSRVAGYVGLTNVMNGMQGEEMMAAPDQLDPILQDIADRGLLFVTGTNGPAELHHVWFRAADLVVDPEPADAPTIDEQLRKLDAIAREKGSALGIIMAPRPVALDRVAAWADGLAGKGVVLAPVSALAKSPAAQDAGVKQDAPASAEPTAHLSAPHDVEVKPDVPAPAEPTDHPAAAQDAGVKPDAPASAEPAVKPSTAQDAEVKQDAPAPAEPTVNASTPQDAGVKQDTHE